MVLFTIGKRWSCKKTQKDEEEQVDNAHEPEAV
jgi:hypothetical protein